MYLNKNVNAVQDYEDILEVVGEYVKGLKVGNVDGLKRAFHENAVMYGFTDQGLLEGTIQNLYDYVKNYGDAPKIKTRFDVLHKTPTTAVVRVELENDAADGNFTDYHSLIKVGNEWKIVAKLFHLYEK
ncbi:nuclear transport factor 2 family protein [Paraburkholderia sediminicola]|uniref:nuclear transport factor 2 family protein n=1 Tax=Paraburkholderia sediminicola TaxID=458836 RepID=UPI0038BD297F